MARQDEAEATIRIMGEDLVIFRDGSGKIGLLNRFCAHRRASLEFGRIEARGIRCCYHGWHFDVDGTILETPGQTACKAARAVAISAGPLAPASPAPIAAGRSGSCRAI